MILRRRASMAVLLGVAGVCAAPAGAGAVCDPGRIFADAFESGDFVAWGGGSAAIAAARAAAD